MGQISIIQMDPNNFGVSGSDRNGQSSQYYSNQQSQDYRNHQYKINVNQISGPSYTSTQPSYMQIGKPRDDLSNQTRGMYAPGATFAKSSEGFTGLSSFARQVKETVVEKDKPEGQNTLNMGNNDKYSGMYNKYSGGKDQRMASSAIFPNNNSQQAQFNRFPAFNLGWNQGSEQTSQSTQSSNSSFTQNSGNKGNQTAKQKRQRELMEIKKQLDQLNKKMMMNSEKNKGNLTGNLNPHELKPVKHSAVSQSAIFEQNFNNGSSFNSFSDSKPTPTKPVISIQQLYAQKKQNQLKQQNVKEVYQPQRQTTVPNFQKTTFNEWQPSSYGTKTYEADKKVQDYSAKSTPYYKPEPNTYTGYKYDSSTATNLGYGQTGTQKPSFSKNQPPKVDYSYQSYNGLNLNDKSYGSTKVDIPSYQYTQPSESKTQAYSFSKTNDYTSPAQTQAHSYTVPKGEATEIGGFKKKKVINLIESKNQQADLKTAVVYPDTPATSNSSNQNQNHIRRIDSYNYQDPTIPLPQLRKFKVTDFAVGKKMGKGQFGQVMLVRHKETGWVCGLKVMNKKQIKDQDYAGQIARQLSIQFYLSHRNIAQLYGYFEDQKNFYLLVEFCSGGQLLEKLKQQHRMNERDVSLIIRQVSQGLDYIHKQLIIHRDIKPENILFNYGVVKISDFGWAVYRGFGMRKTASGSPLYYPPEIVKGESYDDKIDIWCIGMMTYECILGKIPFRVYTQMDLGRIVSDQITFPSWVDVTDDAKDFILKTLKKKGDQRMEIKQILRHPFITKHQEKELSPSILEQFKRVLS